MINAQLGDKEYILHPNTNSAITVAVDEDLMMSVIQGGGTFYRPGPSRYGCNPCD